LWPSAALKGGDAKDNAAALRRMLGGEQGAYREITALNAGAALLVAEKAGSLPDGVKLALAAIDGGAALDCLDRLIEITNRGRSQ
jgi:anthranilate phosphoribosyltransferase